MSVAATVTVAETIDRSCAHGRDLDSNHDRCRDRNFDRGCKRISDRGLIRNTTIITTLAVALSTSFRPERGEHTPNAPNAPNENNKSRQKGIFFT